MIFKFARLICLTDTVRSAPGGYGETDPNTMFNECYDVRIGGKTFFVFDLLVLLSFELGDHFAILAATHQLIPTAVVVVLTVTSAFRCCIPIASLSRSRYTITALVSPGASLRRVIYRDGKSLTISPPPRKLTEHVSGVGFFLVLFSKELFNS